jgi:hypothetical protein
VAKTIDDKIYFGTVFEKIKGAILAKQPDGIGLWQAVWSVECDNGDKEQLSRVDKVAAIRFHGLRILEDTRNIRIISHAVAANLLDECGSVGKESDDVPVPMLSSGPQFLDPRYNLLELLTPTTNQNRLSLPC